jgi:hypothetical protein
LSIALRCALLSGCLVAAAAGAGCGGQSGERSTSAPTQATVGPAQAQVRILSPRDSTIVTAHRTASGNLSASLTVSGEAEALQTVQVDAHCTPRQCLKIVYTGAEGRFRARLRVVLPARTRRWTVTADYPVTSGATTAARVTLRLHAVKSQTPSRRRQSPAGPEAGQGTSTEPEGSGSQAGPPSPTPSPTPSTRQRSLVLVGDSLAVGVRTALPAALPGWRVDVLGRVGRPLAEGMEVIEGLRLQAQSDGARPILAVSLFTNDDPTHTAALQAAVRRTLELVGARGCAIWATIARPPVNGVSYKAANEVLSRLAESTSRLKVVPWAQAVTDDQGLLGADGVHPTPAGYALRARLYAQAAQACP